METIKIYTLSDYNGIRYVGKTKNINKRYYRHIFDAKTKAVLNKRDAWIKSLLSKNLKPIIEVIDEVSVNEWEFWEMYWISQFKTWGFELKNMTNGGEGTYGRITSKLTKDKMSSAKKGKTPKNYLVFRQSTIGKEVVQYDLNGNLVKIWGYIQEAINETKIKNIKSVVNKKRCSAGNYIWRYIDDKLTKSEINRIKDKHSSQSLKPIEQYTIDGTLVKTWTSYRSVKKIYGHIGAVLSGKRKTAGGYKWKYKNK